jgi:ectoine hydroxylase-related dioxygenase (phytanoyl-CoA dioxygenase family)
MAATTESYTTTRDNLSGESIESYRERGFVHVPGIISKEEAERFRQAALELAQRKESLSKSGTFTQLVNAWREDEGLRQLTLHSNVASVAERLAGVPLRLWHDQILIKQPHNNRPTQFHQDQPYWPHANSAHSISAWIALVDVPVERGCMTFIPGSQRRTELRMQNLEDPRSLMSICPDLEWDERVTVPLRAGDCTFHHSRCAHMATPNDTDEPRVAHVVIFMDAGTTYNGQPHVVTDPLHLQVGQPLDVDLFPRIV